MLHAHVWGRSSYGRQERKKPGVVQFPPSSPPSPRKSWAVPSRRNFAGEHGRDRRTLATESSHNARNATNSETTPEPQRAARYSRHDHASTGQNTTSEHNIHIVVPANPPLHHGPRCCRRYLKHRRRGQKFRDGRTADGDRPICMPMPGSTTPSRI